MLTLSLVVAAVGGCFGAPETLTIVSGPPVANQAVAVMLATASEEMGAPVRLTPGPSVDGAEAALEALESGMADLAIVENSSSYRQRGIRTVVSLYPSVLHIGVRPDRQGRPPRELLDGAAVFAGGEGSPARYLLDLLSSMYTSGGIELSYVDSISGADVIFVFAPISPQLAPLLEAYELYSLGRADEVGAGSLADGLSLVAPLLRPFVIPEGTYGAHTENAIATVAIDTLLVTGADTSGVAVYDLMQALQMMGPRLVAQRPDLNVDELEEFDMAHLTFPLHEGALAFRARNEPGFYERAAGVFEAAVTAVAAFGAVFVGLLGYWRGLRKARIDDLYAEALSVRARLSESLGAEQRAVLAAQLRTLRERAFMLLMKEKLAADESFRILQALIEAVLAEIEKQRGGGARASGRAAAACGERGSHELGAAA